MLFRLFGLLILSAAVAAPAQQETPSGNSAPQGTSGNGGSKDSSSTGSSSTNAAGSSNNSSSSQKSQKSASQPLKPATPDELKFPEDDASQQPPSAPAPSTANTSSPDTPRTLTPPRSDRVEVQDLGRGSGESSSKDKDSDVDLSAPADDAKQHPQSSEAVSNAEADSLSPGGVTELRTWDPHKAAKDVEVGDFYFKRQNYRAAEARYRDALLYKDNDAIATIKLAECLEKLGVLDDARTEYQSYLKILPHGPQSGEAQKGIARLDAQAAAK